MPWSTEGFFINAATGETVKIREHATDAMLYPAKFGLTEAEEALFKGRLGRSRSQFRRRLVAMVLRKGWIRARGNGRSDVSFEFAAALPRPEAAKAIRRFLEERQRDFLWVKGGALDVEDLENRRRVAECEMALGEFLALSAEELERALFEAQ